MTFRKVVKAPAKIAHIKNYPHKRSEAESRSMVALLDHAKRLALHILVSHGYSQKLHYYTELKEVERSLKALRCYDENHFKCAMVRAKYDHFKLISGFF